MPQSITLGYQEYLDLEAELKRYKDFVDQVLIKGTHAGVFVRGQDHAAPKREEFRIVTVKEFEDKLANKLQHMYWVFPTVNK